MISVAGFEATGRRTVGPASDLVELQDAQGLPCTAIVFHERYRSHPALGGGLDVVRGFLEAPMVTGLVELVHHDREQGVFVYPTGTTWSLFEVVRTCLDLGRPPGVRAGLEVLYGAGQILMEAAEYGSDQGVPFHGSLSPWRVLARADGVLQVIGYGLPQVEVLQYLANPDEVPLEDSFRYCPPERLDENAPEDFRSDIFALALVAFEVMTGRPVYDGLLDEIRTQAARGECSRRLFRFRETLPEPVRKLLTTCLRPDPSDRPPTGEAFLEAVSAVLSGPGVEGESVADVMARVVGAERGPGNRLESSATQVLSREALRARAGVDLDEDEPPRRGGRRVETFKPAARRRAPVRARQESLPAAHGEPVSPPAAAEEAGRPLPDADEVVRSLRASVRRPRVRRKDAEGAGLSDSGSRRAAALLEALRASGGGEERRTASPEEPAGKGPRRPPEGVRRPPRRRAPPEDGTVLMGRAAGGRAPAPPSRESKSEPPAASRPAERPRSEPERPSRESRAAPSEPAPPRAGRQPRLLQVTGGRTLPFQVRLGAQLLRTRIPAEAPLCEAVARMTASILPVPLDPTGRLLAGWRLGNAEGPLPGATRAREVAGTPLVLHRVEARYGRVDLRIDGGEEPLRLQAAACSAVPVASFVEGLVDWLGLEGGTWTVEHEGRELSPFLLLDELPLDDHPLLVVRLRR